MSIEIKFYDNYKYRETENIINLNINTTITDKSSKSRNKELLKEKIRILADDNFNHLSFFQMKNLGEFNKNITIEKKSDIFKKEGKQLSIISTDVVETAEEYFDLLKEFENVDVHELFQSSPHIEKIAENYLWEKTGKAEFFQALQDNPGALAGFLIGLKLINDQIEANKTYVDSAKEMISSSLEIALENVPSPALAAMISTVSAFQAFKDGNTKLGAAHCLGVFSIAFCASYDLLFANATVSTHPSTNVVFDSMRGLKKLKE